MNKSGDNYIGVLLEEIRDQNRALLDGMRDLPIGVDLNMLERDVDGLEQSISVMKVAMSDLSQDMKAIKAGLADNSRDLAKHERRVSRSIASPSKAASSEKCSGSIHRPVGGPVLMPLRVYYH